MVFPILGGNSAVGGYAIDNSLRFNDNDTARLTRTPSANGNQKTFTTSFWVKKGNLSDCTIFSFGTSPTYNISVVESGSEFFLATTQVGVTQVWSGKSEGKYRDVSAWYHVVIAIDTTQATSSNRVKAYINGNFVSNQSGFTYPSQNYNAIQNPQTTWAVGSRYDGNNPADMYLAEIHHIDGQQLDASSFGEFDEDSGIWKPKEYEGTYGTNGFYLDFENSGSLGADQSGNGNDFTLVNLASTDQTTDTPTNNFCTWNPLDSHSGNTFSEGNLKLNGANSSRLCSTTFGPSQGKWYQEFKLTVVNSGSIGVVEQGALPLGGNLFVSGSDNTLIYFTGPSVYINGSNQGSITGGFSNNDILQIALDLDNNNVYYGKNGLWTDGIGGGFDQSDFSNAQAFSLTRTSSNNNIIFSTQNGASSSSFELIANWGNPPYTISSGNSDQNGYGNFEYAPPSGYLALCTQNLATELSPTIDDGSAYFHTQLYVGNGGTQSITNDANAGDFQPDWIWGSLRDEDGGARFVFDSSRGTTNRLKTNDGTEEQVRSGVTAFNSNGFTVGSHADSNFNAKNLVAWQWVANGGTTSSNTDGTITSTVQANTTAGFSIVTYTGNSIAGATVGHGLGKVPAMFIIKNRGQSNNWPVYHQANTSAPETELIKLDETAATSDSTLPFNDTAPTSTVFSVSSWDGVNSSSYNYVAYCFAEIEGYSKFGSYTGNGSNDGTFVYTGFRPAWIMYKNTSRGFAGAGWFIWDNKRNTFNVVDNYLFANSTSVEGNFDSIDFTSNGFKLRTSDGGQNASGETIIYMAFAENPFVSSTAIPVTAR